MKGDKVSTNGHLNNIGKELLETVGLREALTEKWKPGATGGRLPGSLSDIMDDVNTKVWSGYVDAPAKNGMHSWHAGTNAALAQRLGPVGSLFVLLGGIYHETPFDKGSFKAEQAAQGTVNHILDSFSDIISNGIGHRYWNDFTEKSSQKCRN